MKVEKKLINFFFSFDCEMFFCYMLIQFVLMMAIMMGNMKTCQIFSTLPLPIENFRFPWLPQPTQVSANESEYLLNYIFLLKLNFFLPQFLCLPFRWWFFVPLSNDFQVQWMKINNWKKNSWQSNEKREHKSCFNNFFTSSLQTTFCRFIPTPVKQRFSTFHGFNYFSFVCEIMNIPLSCFIDVEHFSIADFLSEVENQRKFLIRLWSLQVRKREMLSPRCKSEQTSSLALGWS